MEAIDVSGDVMSESFDVMQQSYEEQIKLYERKIEDLTEECSQMQASCMMIHTKRMEDNIVSLAVLLNTDDIDPSRKVAIDFLLRRGANSFVLFQKAIISGTLIICKNLIEVVDFSLEELIALRTVVEALILEGKFVDPLQTLKVLQVLQNLISQIHEKSRAVVDGMISC